MLEKEIKIELAKRELKPSDIYKKLDIGRAHFYQAIRSSNLKNKTLIRILDFLDLDIVVNVKQREKA